MRQTDVSTIKTQRGMVFARRLRIVRRPLSLDMRESRATTCLPRETDRMEKIGR